MRKNPLLAAKLDELQSRGHLMWGSDSNEQRVLRRRAVDGELVRVYGSFYARTSYWSSMSVLERYRCLIRSISAFHPHWVFGGMTAAAIYGINDSTRHAYYLERMVTLCSHQHDYGRIRHRYLIEHAQIPYVRHDGVRVTTIDRTIFDCARFYELPDALAVVEAALRQGHVEKKHLLEYFRTASGHHRAQALAALRYASGKTENGGEAFALGVMIQEGYMVPTLQMEFEHPFDSSRVDRVDYAWRTASGKLIVAELDGRMKYRDETLYVNGSLPDTIIAEKEREERICLVADELIRFSFSDALYRDVLVAKLDKAGVPKTKMSSDPQ